MAKNNVHLYKMILESKEGSQESNIQRVWKKHRSDIPYSSFRRMFMLWKSSKSKKSSAPKKSIKDDVSALIKKGKHESIEAISDALDVGVSKVREAIKELTDVGHNFTTNGDRVFFSNVIPKSEPTKLDVKKMSTGFYRFGAVGDNHMGSKYERADVLEALYDLFESEGIKVVYNTGNWIDGEARFNKHDLNVHGMDNQIRHFVQNYPQRKGITTYFIAGDDHEGWYTQREGVDIGRYAEFIAREEGRKDLVYLGYMEADVHIKAKNGETVVRVLHPGGGSSYATSYSIQKIVESYQGGEKPHVLLAGHYHKADYLYYRGVHCVQTGTTQDQSPFMRKKKLAAHLGGWIIEFHNDDNGAITRFKQEFIPFYDNSYYKKWSYKFNERTKSAKIL